MRVLFRVLIAVAAGFAAVTFVPAQAQAAPAGCSSSEQENTARAKCTRGTGQVRVVIECYQPRTDATVRTYGRWVNVGGTSTKRCVGSQYLVGHWYETGE